MSGFERNSHGGELMVRKHVARMEVGFCVFNRSIVDAVFC